MTTEKQETDLEFAGTGESCTTRRANVFLHSLDRTHTVRVAHVERQRHTRLRVQVRLRHSPLLLHLRVRLVKMPVV
jgi:hypothetical protein